MYVNHEPITLFDVEALIYVQEAQLHKVRQELAILNIFANIDHTNSQTGDVHENFAKNYGKGHMTSGRGRSSSDTRPTCQLYGKYGHFVADCWHVFDETFTPL